MTEEKPSFTFAQKWSALSRHLRPYRATITQVALLGVIAAAANGIVPLVTGRFFDALVTPHAYALGGFASVPAWAALLLLWSVIQLLANGVSWAMDRKNRRFTTELQAGLQARAFMALLRLPVSFSKQHRTGEISDLINKSGWMLESMASTIVQLAPQLLTVVVGVGIAFMIEPRLALILLLGLAAYGTVLARILPHMARYQEEGHRAWNKAYGDAYDAFANLGTVKQANAEAYEEKRITKSFWTSAIPLWYRIEREWSDLNFSQRIVVTATQGIILFASVALVMRGSMTIGDLIAFNAYAGLIIGPFVSLGQQWQNIQNGLVAVTRAEVIFGATPETYEPEDSRKKRSIDGDVTFDDVHFSYEPGQPEVLSGVSFSARAGEVVALVGETGAGKSTAAELISAYYFPTEGTVSIDGIDTRELRLDDLRSRIAVVPQEVVLFNASIADNIRYGRPGATDAEVRAAARRAHADSFIKRFPKKYQQEVGERGVKLSAGQKQRIAIARAMLRNPSILVLDEPTSALDSETERAITESLEELMQGRTTFIIAHRLSTVRKADRILVLADGVIIEQGTHYELMRIPDGTYRRLYRLHTGVKDV